MTDRNYTLQNGNELIVTEQNTLFVCVANEGIAFTTYPDMVFGEVLKLVDTLNAEIKDLRTKHERLSLEYVENLLLLKENESESVIIAEELLRLKNLDYESFTILEQELSGLVLVD
ncbi:hypothetical protein [Paenibacillus solani]|uniref:hypothetical protein n=1 Tax=Paenibacillus solani TaxID=1705565 RepID=UPI003D29963A